MRAVFDIAAKKRRIGEIESGMESSGFWDDRKNAEALSEELSHLKQEVRESEQIKKEISETEEFMPLIEQDSEIAKELMVRVQGLQRSIEKEETQTFFSGPYDKLDAILTIYSGAGGIDAQDWAGMLLRMYERYGANKGYNVSLLSQRLGEEKGVKEASLEISGRYSYGYLKKENGVHRLVRISPYSAQKLRHTSFALVEVLPQLSKGSPEEIEIRPEDIEVQTFRSSGPGGQYVNKRESAVRVKHLPTGIVVECQSERLQGENKAGALKLLAAKLFARKMKEEQEKIEKIRGGFVSAEWSNQIRSYVLHPYQMVKDHRTGVETSDADGVLDGELDEFIEASIKS